LHPSLSQETEVVLRFRREAEAVSRLSHPNTVQVFDFGEAHGSLYLVMELVRGEDLGILLKRDGPLTWSRLGPMLSQVLDALAEAHELGVIHRDIKPENLLVARTRDGRDLVKVLDFGLAKLRDVEELSEVTGRGTVLGTPYYMSPEQIRAESLDARSDLYSLGALAYRALTGEHPFSAPTPVAVLTQHLMATLRPPRSRDHGHDIPVEVEALILRAMARSPDDRFQSAEAMRTAVAETLSPSINHELLPSGMQRRASDLSAHSSGALPAAERMQREDFDTYERGLSVRRWVALSVVPLLLALAGVVAWTMLAPSRERAAVEEHEPNDDAAHANLLASGQAIRGQVGKRRNVEESDRDFYRLVVPPGATRLVAEVTGIPEMDLILQVFDAQGHELAVSETGAEGDAEAIFDLHVAPGDYYIEVREVWVRGQQPTENVSDWYSLRATADAAPPDEELEPNGTDADANIAAVPAMSGRLSHPGDIDCYVVPGHVAAIGANVTGLAGVDLKLSVHGRNDKGGARTADRAATGAGEKLDAAAWPPAAGAPIVCVERKDHVPVEQAAHAEHTPHVGLPSRTALYRLQLDVRR
ncbi:MAG: protein kinase, partial [Polyangia bacterium]